MLKRKLKSSKTWKSYLHGVKEYLSTSVLQSALEKELNIPNLVKL